jgi:hypothetical protein
MHFLCPQLPHKRVHIFQIALLIVFSQKQRVNDYQKKAGILFSISNLISPGRNKTDSEIK